MRTVRLLLLLLLATTLFSLAVAHAEQETEQETETREVSIETDMTSVEIESKQKNLSDRRENVFEVEFEADEQVEIKLKFKEETPGNGSESEEELSYAVETESLIEFEDANSNGVFDDGEAVSRYSLEDADFEPIAYTTQQTDSGVTDHVITAQSTDGVFTITLHVVGSFAEIGSTTVTPTEVKFDLAIKDYPFESDDSRIAIMSKLKTERETERNGIKQEEGVSIPWEDVIGFFTWQPTVNVDGETASVAAAIRPRSEIGEQGIILAYPQGDTIIHDPRVGFQVAEDGNDMFLPIIVLLAIVGATAVVGIRRYR